MENNNEVPLEVVEPSALEAISRAEVDIAIDRALRRPRELSKVKQKMMSFATLDEETAQACFYSLPRGNKVIQGPSVRLAEIAVSCFTNLRAGSRIISTVTQGDTPHVVVQAVAMDLENNVSVSIEKRRRITKKKNREKIDEDDINLAANACSAIAFRDSVFKIVPLALIKPVFEAARKVAIGDARTLADRRAKCIDAFGKMGIDKTRVLARVEKAAIESIDLADIELLIGLYNAIKEGDVQLDDAFPTATTHTPVHEGPGQPPHGKEPIKPEKPPQEPPKAPEGTPMPTKEEKSQVQSPSAENKASGKPSEAPQTPVTPPQTPETSATDDDDEKALAEAGLAPEQPKAQEQAPAAPAEPDAYLANRKAESDACASVKLLAIKSGVSGAQLRAWLVAKKLSKPEQGLHELSQTKLEALNRTWAAKLPEIRAQKV